MVYAWKNTLSKKHLEDVDIVISIGGDGTALSASHYLEEKPLLAVNSDPDKSEGALTTLSVGELEEKLEEVKNGFEIEYLEEYLKRNNSEFGFALDKKLFGIIYF
jgi:NAD kinase